MRRIKFIIRIEKDNEILKLLFLGYKYYCKFIRIKKQY